MDLKILCDETTVRSILTSAISTGLKGASRMYNLVSAIEKVGLLLLLVVLVADVLVGGILLCERVSTGSPIIAPLSATDATVPQAPEAEDSKVRGAHATATVSPCDSSGASAGRACAAFTKARERVPFYVPSARGVLDLHSPAKKPGELRAKHCF